MTIFVPTLCGQYVMVWRTQEAERQNTACQDFIHRLKQICVSANTNLEAHEIDWHVAVRRMIHVAEGFSGRSVPILVDHFIGSYVAVEFELTTIEQSSMVLLKLCKLIYRECIKVGGVQEGLLLDKLSTALIPLRDEVDEEWPLFKRLIQIHSVLDSQAVNLHTHGLAKFGKPDLSIVCPKGVDIAHATDHLTSLAEQYVHLRSNLSPLPSITTKKGMNASNSRIRKEYFYAR